MNDTNVEDKSEKVHQSVVSEVVAMYENGIPIAQIRNEMGKSTATIYSLLREGGVEPKRRDETGKSIVDFFPKQVVDGIIGDYTKGEGMIRIREKYEISINSIYTILHDTNTPLRRLPPAEGKIDARLEQAVKMYEEGYKLIRIEVETGVSQMRLYKELYKRKIPLRRDQPLVAGRGE